MSQSEKHISLKDQISTAFLSGEFMKADSLINVDLLDEKDDSFLIKEYEIIRAKMSRIELDFRKDEGQIIEQLKPTFPDLSSKQMVDWEKSGELEMKIINGKKRYFNYAVNNLYRLNKEAQQKRNSIFGEPENRLNNFCIGEAKEITEHEAENLENKEKNWHISFTISLDPGIVPEGETVRCWMPFPKPHPTRLTNIKLLTVNDDDYFISDSSSFHRSLYLEKPANDSVPVVFEYEVEFTTQPEWTNISQISAKPYNTQSALYINNTKEQEPHIVFSQAVKDLADSLTIGLTNPIEIVHALYYWINDNIPWASALEYSTFECIPDYSLKYRHGDCGMVSFLFMSMARYKGIPVKWQSGWMLHPGYKNLHDWTEVYYEGIGWLPLDMSFGLMPSSEIEIKEYYISGIDTYRMIVNDAVADEFIPKKKFHRSEPFDFQRGELEWSGGNLYFNQWNYSLKIIESHEK